MGQYARPVVGADGGADERNGHAKAGGVSVEPRVLEPFVELLEVPLEGAVAQAVGRGAFSAAGGAPPGREGRPHFAR